MRKAWLFFIAVGGLHHDKQNHSFYAERYGFNEPKRLLKPEGSPGATDDPAAAPLTVAVSTIGSPWKKD